MNRLYFLSFILLLMGQHVMAQDLPTDAVDISPLLISESLPEIEVMSMDGKKVLVTDLVTDQKAVLIFYRGGWCPYCTSHLSAVGEVEKEISDMGYQILAFSPDSPDNTVKTEEKVKTQYALYTDPGGALMKALGIAFQAPDRYGDMLANYSDDLNPGLLPVPSIFVVDTNGVIVFEYISPDYKQRMSADLLQNVLKALE